MHSVAGWKLARRPNYITNSDKAYPYSEVPFLGEYHLVKIPTSLNNLIEHVDYWGEGKIVTQHGTSGFSNCYNVNHTYQLVSNGPDRGWKIPNRIPVVNYTNCDTSSYIKDNSVKTVTVMGAPINSSCAKDIARIVNTDFGRVIAYGFESKSQEIKNLITELKKKRLLRCPKYTLPNELQGLTLFDCNMAFLNLTTLKDELYKYVTNGSYDNAVDLTKNMNNESGSEAISDIVTKLISTNASNIMIYAYKLWQNESKDIVRKNFPEPFKLIFDEAHVTIVNVQYHQALKLDANTNSNNDRLAWGDNADKTSTKVTWKLFPVWYKDNVAFKLYNIEYKMNLKLDGKTDTTEDGKAWGSIDDNGNRHKYYLEPVMEDGTLMFHIINCQYDQGLKMDSAVNSIGDRAILGINSNARINDKSLKWVISANSKERVKEVIEI